MDTTVFFLMDSQEVMSPLASPHLACLHAAKHTHTGGQRSKKGGTFSAQPNSVYYVLIGLF